MHGGAQVGGDAGADANPGRTRPGRLRRRSDFLAAGGAKRFHTERMSVQTRIRGADEVRDGGPVEGLQVGFTITKRVGHATERNRIRRRLRRAVEQAVGDAIALPADFVVIARRPALTVPFETLVDDLRRALAAARKRASKPVDTAASSGTRRVQSAHPTRRRGSSRDGSPTPSTQTTPHGTTDG